MNMCAVIWPAWMESKEFRQTGAWPINGTKGKYFQNVQLKNVQWWEFILGDLGRCLFITIFFILPIYNLGILKGILFGLFPISMQGALLYNCTMVSHAGDDILGESISPNDVGDWAVHQALCTHDFETEGLISSWMWSGANSQVLHHLFPAVDADHFPGIIPTLRETLKEYNVEHCNMMSWAEVVTNYYRWAWNFDPAKRSVGDEHENCDGESNSSECSES